MGKHRKMIIGLVVALCCAGILMIGCSTNTQNKTTSNANQQTQTAATAENDLLMGRYTMAEMAEMYPLEYNSFAVLKTKAGTDDYEGHYTLNYKLLAPVAKLGAKGNTIDVADNGDFMVNDVKWDSKSKQWVVVAGDYDPLLVRSAYDVKGCYACKSSTFTVLAEKEGLAIGGEAIDQEFLDQMEGNIWDCYICHESGNPSEGYDCNTVFLKQIAMDIYDDLTPEDRVCGQCHNHAYTRDLFVSDLAAQWDAYQPFKYGLDPDSVLKAEKEAGMGMFDKDATTTTYRAAHADMEVMIGSNHYSLGVTCIDCHMPQTTDETSGKTYSSHDASMSPLANEDALNFCLTCHKSQSINSTQEMVDMVHALQDKTASFGAQISEKCATLKGLIGDAAKAGTMDKALLDQARDSYTTAMWYNQWTVAGNEAEYNKVVHNPELTASLMNRADKLATDAIALFK